MEKSSESKIIEEKKGLSRVWQIIAGVGVFLLAAVVSIIEMISQTRKYKKASIPIEVSSK